VEFPSKVTSSGGRYQFHDDWQTTATQVASFEFDGGATITWEGRSCNGRTIENRGRGASIHGTEGTVIIDRSGYVIYDQENKEVARRIRADNESGLDTRGGGSLTDLHLANFQDAIRGKATPAAPIEEGHKTVLLCHLGNIAQRTGGSLACDPSTGHIVGDAAATKLWSREYEPGWEPNV